MQQTTLNRILGFYLFIGILDILLISTNDYLSGDFYLVLKPNLGFLDYIIVGINYILPIALCFFLLRNEHNALNKKHYSIILFLTISKIFAGILFRYGAIGTSIDIPLIAKPFLMVLGRINLSILLPLLVINTNDRKIIIILSFLVLIYAVRIQSIFPVFILAISFYLSLPKKLILPFLLTFTILILKGTSLLNYAYSIRDSIRNNTEFNSEEIKEVNQAISRKAIGRITGISNFIIFKSEHKQILELGKTKNYIGTEFVSSFFASISSPISNSLNYRIIKNPNRLFTEYIDPKNGNSYGVILGGLGSLLIFSSIYSYIIPIFSLLFIVLCIIVLRKLSDYFLDSNADVILPISLISVLISMSSNEFFDLIQSVIILGLFLKLRWRKI